jgi:hypothetical protein
MRIFLIDLNFEGYEKRISSKGLRRKGIKIKSNEIKGSLKI